LEGVALFDSDSDTTGDETIALELAIGGMPLEELPPP